MPLGWEPPSAVSEALLQVWEQMSECASLPPWRSMAEGRDHESGDSFIQVSDDDDRYEHVYVSRDSGPAFIADLDFIAAARNYLPVLIEEVHRLRLRLGE